MITTIKLKDLIKYLVGLIIIIFIGVYSTRFFMYIKNQKVSSIDTDTINLIKYNISIANYIEKETNKEERNKSKATSRSRVNAYIRYRASLSTKNRK